MPPLPGDDGSRAFAEDWLSGQEGFARAQNTGAAAVADGVEPWDLPQNVIDDPDLVKGELLLALGRRAEGLQLLEQIFWRFYNDPAALYRLMLRFHKLDANKLSITAAHRLIELSPAERIAEVPLFIQRFRLSRTLRPPGREAGRSVRVRPSASVRPHLSGEPLRACRAFLCRRPGSHADPSGHRLGDRL